MTAVFNFHGDGDDGDGPSLPHFESEMPVPRVGEGVHLNGMLYRVTDVQYDGMGPVERGEPPEVIIVVEPVTDSGGDA